MKALHPLTEDREFFAEKHHDFIYQYLNGRHLNIEDYYDTAVFGYLKAVQDYLENRNFSSTASPPSPASPCGMHWQRNGKNRTGP